MEPFVYTECKRIPHFFLSHWEKEFPHLTVGFSSKKDSSSWNRYNYALHVTKHYEEVIHNRTELTKVLGIPFTSWTSGEQVHSTHVVNVSKEGRGKGRLSQTSAFSKTDGLITEEYDIFLATYYADCVPLYFYSPGVDIIAIAHAGWKGTCQNIAKRVIQELVRQGAMKDNLRVAIGPSIGSCCYEVDENVMKKFKKVMGDTCGWFRSTTTSRWNLDLKEVNKILINREGVPASSVEVSKWCTSCNPHYFYSYRRDSGETGRMVAWIGKRCQRLTNA